MAEVAQSRMRSSHARFNSRSISYTIPVISHLWSESRDEPDEGGTYDLGIEDVLVGADDRGSRVAQDTRGIVQKSTQEVCSG